MQQPRHPERTWEENKLLSPPVHKLYNFWSVAGCAVFAVGCDYCLTYCSTVHKQVLCMVAVHSVYKWNTHYAHPSQRCVPEDIILPVIQCKDCCRSSSRLHAPFWLDGRAPEEKRANWCRVPIMWAAPPKQYLYHCSTVTLYYTCIVYSSTFPGPTATRSPSTASLNDCTMCGEVSKMFGQTQFMRCTRASSQPKPYTPNAMCFTAQQAVWRCTRSLVEACVKHVHKLNPITSPVYLKLFKYLDHLKC